MHLCSFIPSPFRQLKSYFTLEGTGHKITTAQVMLLSLFHAVGIWCDMLGDLYSGESPLRHCQPKQSYDTVTQWISFGKASK
jgi:hypothetical protein